MTTLAALCEQHAPAAFEFLKVDVEGAEADVLRGADFSRLRPKVIVVEAIKPFSLAPAWDEWEPLLARHGYAYVWDDELNRYYVAEEARALAETLTAGPKWYADGPQIGNFKPAAEDPAHPDHRLARLLAGAEMAKLPLMDRAALLDMLTAGIADLDRPASAADIAADHGAPVRLSRSATDRAAGRRNHSRRLSPDHRFRCIPRILRPHRGELRVVTRALSCPRHTAFAIAVNDPRARPRGHSREADPGASCRARIDGTRTDSDAWRARRSARAVAPAPRGDGGAGQRAGTPQQDRGADRRQHGGGGLLRLRAARRRHARAVRLGRPEAGSRARHRAAPGRRPGRPRGERGEIAQPLRRAASSGLLVPPGDRRRNLPLVPRRPDPARRQHARRAGGAEPRAPHLFGGGRGGAADHRDGARRDHRVGRAVGARQARRSSLPRTGRCSSRACRSPTASASAMWCCTSRASIVTQADRRRSAEGAAAARRRAQHAARRSRRDAGAARCRRRRRAPRGARSLPHVRA